MEKLACIFVIFLLILSPNLHAQSLPNETTDASTLRFEELSQLSWQTVFYDSCTADWQRHWTLDGKLAHITHSERGMDFWAGHQRKVDAHHAVLWTKPSFEGDLRIDYTYTKLDDRQEAVNILYVQATGSGEGEFKQDIASWADLREVPAMRTYFQHMNLLHISYAAFPLFKEGEKEAQSEDWQDYIRARRYLPQSSKGLKETDLDPDYFQTGLFEQGVPYQITVIKHGDDFFMFIHNDADELLCHWRLDQIPPITEGRIGLRHMWTRGARYRDFRVSQLN
ncbi:MAG: hypothetical protein AAF804_10655 [Bacteroidota bacterium]